MNDKPEAWNTALDCVHRGHSMEPVLHEGDLLQILPVEGALSPGDVIIFRPPGWSDQVVHRVVTLTADGVVTRGDNCRDNDPWTTHPGEVLGRVTGLRRGRREIPVHGGERGMRAAGAAHCRRTLEKHFAFLLRPLYRALAWGGLFRTFLPRRLRPRVVVFHIAGRDQRKLLLGERIIGSWDEGRGEWRIRRPWRLFVNVTSLPGTTGEEA